MPFDSIQPLERTSRRYKHILMTMMGMYTKYPETMFVLKMVDNESVLEAMTDIVAIPKSV